MSQLIFNRSCTSFHISTAFVDTLMPAADATFVKVYIYALRHSFEHKIDFSIEKIAVDLNILDSDVVKAFEYWDKKGALIFTKEKNGYSIEFLDLNKNQKIDSLPKVDNNGRPKYSAREIGNFIKNNAEMKNMYELAQRILAKPLSSTEISVLYSFHDWLKLPNEVILMLLEHCAALGKTKIRYIEKVAISWSEQGINTICLAKEHLNNMAQKNEFKNNIRKILQIKDRNFTDTELKYIEDWTDNYGATLETIKQAYEITVLNTSKLSFPYMNTVLKGIVENREKPDKKAVKKGFTNYNENSQMCDFEKEMLKKRMEKYNTH